MKKEKKWKWLNENIIWENEYNTILYYINENINNLTIIYEKQYIIKQENKI